MVHLRKSLAQVYLRKFLAQVRLSKENFQMCLCHCSIDIGLTIFEIFGPKTPARTNTYKRSLMGNRRLVRNRYAYNANL